MNSPAALPFKRLEHDVIAALRQRRAIPGAVEGDERPAAIGCREMRRRHRSPWSLGAQCPGKAATGGLLGRADADLLAAVAAIFGRQHQLVLIAVEVTFRPAEIGALFELDELFRRQIGPVGGIEFGPVLPS